MLPRCSLLILFSALTGPSFAQLPVARDHMIVHGAAGILSMPWAGGINSANVSNADINMDGRQDLVFFDRQDIYGYGIFRCFLHDGVPGQVKFRSDPGLSYFFPPLSSWAVLRDYDQDGRADIFTSTSGGIKVYRNETVANGLPKFTLVNPLIHSNYHPQTTPVNRSNLYAGSAGAPGIFDVDGDQDLDILTFSPVGIYMEMHRNMSQEMYGHSDSLIFQREDPCWGDLAENSCSVDLEICSGRLAAPARELHAGACIACLDSDGDQDVDLIMGDIACDYVHYVHNGGSGGVADFTDTTRLYPNFPQKNSDATYIKMSSFPCAYPVDADNDGKTDLIATPNVTGGENVTSVWLYRNASATSTVDFKLHKKNFLQDEMIDVGRNSYPVLVDYDADGRKDLLIGSTGIFESGQLSSKLVLYRNIGSVSVPVFSLVSTDYCAISTYSFNGAIPAVGDLDSDGDIDILLGNSPGQIHWLENTAGPGKTLAFAPLKINPFQFTTPSGMAAPQVFDLDSDGRQDLIVGMMNGQLAWYRNTANAGATPTLNLMSSFLGKVSVKGDPSMYGLNGFAAPHFFNEGGETFVLVGSVTGQIYMYKVPSATADFQLVTAGVNGLLEGSQSTVCYEDINDDGKRDLFVGNSSGGLSFFSSASPNVGMEEREESGPGLISFPNPAGDAISVRATAAIKEVLVSDITGRTVLQVESFASGSIEINVSELQSGVYFLRAVIGSGNQHSIVTRRFLKE